MELRMGWLQKVQQALVFPGRFLLHEYCTHFETFGHTGTTFIYDISDVLTGDYEEEIKSSTNHPIYSDD